MSTCVTSIQVHLKPYQNICSSQNLLAQGIKGLYRACIHLSTAACSITSATWQFSQALRLLQSPLWRLAGFCAVAALQGTFEAVLHWTGAILRLSVALAHGICLSMAVAAHLAILAAALAASLILLLMPLAAVATVGWVLYKAFMLQGATYNLAAQRFGSSLMQRWPQQLLQIRTALTTQLQHLWLSLARILPVTARAALIFCLRQLLGALDQLSVFLMPRHCLPCTICLESIPQRQMVCAEGCTHSYCKTCLAIHLQTRLENNRRDMMRCAAPGCKASFSVAQCRPALRHNRPVGSPCHLEGCLLCNSFENAMYVLQIRWITPSLVNCMKLLT